MNSIMFYRWGSILEPTLNKYLHRNCINVYEYSRTMSDYHVDSNFSIDCMQFIEKNKIEAIISFDYFPLLSLICAIRNITYISWIYDCPNLTLESYTLSNDCNYIFCFDELYTDRLTLAGAKHCFHMPLAGDPEMSPNSKYDTYISDISFIGGLYNDKNNRFRNVTTWSEYESGYLESVMSAQKNIYGYNIVLNTLTPKIVSSIIDKCNISLGEMYRFNDPQLAADIINQEISARDREIVLKRISEHHRITLYTGSPIPASLKNPNINLAGIVSYDLEMPQVFNQSKINLNITSRTIESGVPQRVFDILASGGFCITNYQPEIAQMFEDKVDLVMYSDIQEVDELVSYYLSHNNERIQIAQNGHRKILNSYNYNIRINRIFDILSQGAL